MNVEQPKSTTEMNDVPGKVTKKIEWVKLDIRAYMMIASLILVWTFFSMFSDNFLTVRNLSNLFMQMSVTSILAIGMVFIIVSGQIDLSVGSLVGLTGGVAAILNVWLGWSAIPVIVATLAVGALIGFIQGWWVAYRAVPAFIVTLGGMLIFRGALLGITNGTTISSLSPGIKFIGQSYIVSSMGYIFGLIALIVVIVMTFKQRASRAKFGFELKPISYSIGQIIILSLFILGFVFLMNQYRGIPVPFFILIILALILTFIAKNTVFGRQVYAIGGNLEAARLSGINIKRRVLMVFIIGNTLAAIAGLILTSRVGVATTNAGVMYELDAIAAAVIGGTSLVGGVGTISGAIIGALVMASLDNGMSIMNVDFYWQSIVKGSILVLAVWFDISSRNKKKL